MDPDLNKGDAEHVVTKHERMTIEEWQDIYEEAWSLYYTPEHIERVIRRTVACGAKPVRVMQQILGYSGIQRFEGLHPLQGGLFRRKRLASRRPGFPKISPFKFYPSRVWEVFATYVPFILYGMRLHRLRRRIQRDPCAAEYTDAALGPDEFGGEATGPSPLAPKRLDPPVASAAR